MTRADSSLSASRVFPQGYAFDLLELNGDDLRLDQLQVRKATLASSLAKAGPGIRFNEHMEFEDGEAVFRQACAAVKREAEEDWEKPR